jgi:hypothetical protein
MRKNLRWCYLITHIQKTLTIWKLWNLKNFKVKNLLNKNLKFQESFTTYKWGVMYMTSKAKLYFIIQENKA